ncbi:SDR family NAD(P)-dependent oxidoreductase [Planococcus beigongshangi]|uniref:SDR family NAD(P)-dependent oxidoreductase n=1 Tax=Planococcus beigongshangi TaxID=2782536 RepID=UPI00193BEA93|nr:SDR family oxidoreductase [Planococcus beigongshangi]
MDLAGKVAVVTGGASGIGLATAKMYLAKGAKVVIADFNEEGGKQAAQELKSGGEVEFFQVDVSSEEAVEGMINFAVDTFGTIDILVSNAGVGALSETHELSYEDYHKVIAVNQDSVFFGAKHAIRHMMNNGGGVIVNTASILGSVGEAGAFAYNASKGAVNLMTKSLALQYADKNIRVNAVAPGYVESGMVNRDALGPEFYDQLVSKHPIGRLGQPDEIAHAIIFLSENDFMTGATILVDGGYTAQ